MKSFAHLQFLGSAAIAAALLGGCGNPEGPDTTIEIVYVDSPAAPGSMSPHLAITPAGEAVMSWLEPADGDAHAVRYSVMHGDSWSAAASVVEDDDWFVNWADFPSVVPITEQQWAAHWLVKRPGGTYSYDIALSMSADAGATWAAPLTPHTDGTPTEHGFVTLFPWSDDIGAVWLDGRMMPPDAGGAMKTGEARKYDGQSKPGEPANYGGHPESGEAGKYGGMTLRFARIGYDGEVLEDGKLDELVCDCCQTDAAMATTGPVVAYRDRSADEIRDISVTRHVDGHWSDPITVSDDNWHIPACPVNGPTIVADGERVAVAWYGAPKRESRVKLAWSQDAGQTFSAPIVIDDSNVSGRVDVVLLSDGAAMVSWMGKSDNDVGQVRLRRVTIDGELGPIHVVANGEFTRNTGFPQMVRAGDHLVFAWPEPGDPQQVRTAFLTTP